MVIGDFNIVLNGVDKIGGQVVARSSNGGLRRVINNYGLIDVGFVGHAFTWSNRRGGLANIQEQLDRGFANADWRTAFPEATITHLPAIESDHRLLLLQMNPSTNDLPKPFKFESMWILHPGTSYIIDEAWNRKLNLWLD